jgi:OmpA-OmpF porin, OOP family
MRIFKILAAGCLAMGLSACAITSQSDIDAAAALSPKGGTFTKTLHSEYIKLAKMENKEGDHPDAIYFANKARAAASGKAPKADTRKQRDITKKNWKKAKGGLQRLKVMRERGGLKFDPKNMAKAQAGWDCYLQELEENLQKKDIKWCQKYMDKALKGASKSYWASLKKPSGPMVIYFGLGSAALTKDAMMVLDKAAKKAMKVKVNKKGKKKKKVVTLQAHTDTSGNAAANAALSMKRAKAAASYLKSKGVKKIYKTANGERSPAVNSGDNKVESKNRRVVIKIN